MSKKIFIGIAAGSLIISLVLIFIIIIPYWDAVGLLRKEVSAKNIDLETLKQTITRINQLEKEYTNLETEVEKAFLALPKEKDIPSLLIQFEALAAVNDLYMESIDFGEISEPGKERGTMSGAGIGEGVAIRAEMRDVEQTSAFTLKKQESLLRGLSANIQLVGKYADFKKYLNALSDNIRSMDVQSMNLSYSSNESGEKKEIVDKFDFNLEIVVYFQ